MITLERILKEVSNFDLLTNYAINIGCGDGKSNDILYPLFQSGWDGFVIDAKESPDLYTNLPNPKIIKEIGIMTPSNAANYLDQNNCPYEPDILKIDIDGYDGDVLKAILNGGYKPLIIVAEIQPEIPPPISFSVLYSDQYKILDDNGNIGGFYGMSLSYAVNLCSSFGYNLVELDFESPFTHDAIFILGEKFQNPNFRGKITREIWLSAKPGYSHFYEYEISTLNWRNMNNIDGLAREVLRAIVYANTKKHNGDLINFYFDS